MNLFDSEEVRMQILIYPVMTTLLVERLSELTGQKVDHIVEDYSREAIIEIRNIDFSEELNKMLGVHE